MGELSKYPQGFLSTLGIKNMAQAPRDVSQIIAPVVDMAEAYLLNDRIVQTFAGIVAATGPNLYTATGTVPQGELWYVWDFTVGSSLGAGAAITVATAYSPDGINTVVKGDYVVGAATNVILARTPAPFWATPGSVLAFNALSQALAPTLSATILVTKLRI